MDNLRPGKLSVHEFLVRKASVKAMQPESIVEKIISHQHKSINKAFKEHSTIEVTGFCKFVLSKPKMRKKLKRMKFLDEAMLKRLSINPLDEEAQKLHVANEKYISHLLSKLGEDETGFQGTTRGNQEHLLSKGRSEETNRGDSRGENSDVQGLSALFPQCNREGV